MAWCSASTCRNSKAKRPDLSFFSVPSDESLWKQWLINGGREDLLEKPIQYARKTINFCAEHFEDDQFLSILKRNRLEAGAVPTIFKQSAASRRKNGKHKKLLKKCSSKKKNSKPNKNAGAKSFRKVPLLKISVKSLAKDVRSKSDTILGNDANTDLDPESKMIIKDVEKTLDIKNPADKKTLSKTPKNGKFLVTGKNVIKINPENLNFAIKFI